MDGAFDTYFEAPAHPERQALPLITDALNATLDPRVPNETRKQALQHLESYKYAPDAPNTGFLLADDWKYANEVRYFGLQLLEHAVRYRWNEWNAQQKEQIRQWVKFLAGSLREEDAAFLRAKTAQVWVEVAKRCWGGGDASEEQGWPDMDQLLVNMWERPVSEKGTVNKLFVLYVLETLSEDVINKEDAVAGLRLDVLGDALNQIMAPPGLLNTLHSTWNANDSSKELRSGDDGWFSRMLDFFHACVKQVRLGGDGAMMSAVAACAVKALQALRPTIAWINLKAALEVNVVECLFISFETEDVVLQTATTEVLYALLSRPYSSSWQDTWLRLIGTSLHQQRISLLRRSFEWTHTSPGDDNGKYTLQKKLSELLSVLADAVAQHPVLAGDSDANIPAFFNLLVVVLQSKSLVVSIPVLHSWTKLMSTQDQTVINLVLQALGTLVQTCSARLLRYESLPNDVEDEITQFLDEDFDTTPERHAFLGNYRRYCVNIITNITRSRPLEALSHVLEEMRQMLESGPYTGGRGFDPAAYSKVSVSTLQFDAQYQVVSSALKGYSQWLADIATVSPEEEVHARAENDKSSTQQLLQQWSYNVINTHTDDPEVAAQVLQTLVTILRTINPDSAFVLHVVQHLLTMRLYDNPSHSTFSDAVKSFEGLRVLELQKLALAFSNELLEVYNELAPRIEVLVQKHSDDPRLVWGYKAFLFMIIHRASGVDPEMRLARLRQMLEPVYSAWNDQAFTASLASLQSFCDTLGLGGIAEFYKAYGFDRFSDWASQQLDEAGQARQAEIKAKGDALPLRMTKSLLAATTEKLRSGTDEYDVAIALWSDIIPSVLPNLLPLLKHATAFNNLSNWTQLPDELQAVVKRTLQDRFWQSGISNESKDEFYARISGSKTSYEGFASAVRGCMRNVREQSYHLIYLMTKFEEQFYGLTDLSEPLSQALFEDATALNANHLHPIINLSTGLVQRCPPHYRAVFLPPLLTQLFTKLDTKISSEWNAIAHASERNADEEEQLGDEMRMESVLRQLTFSMVSFVPFLLEFDTPPPPVVNGNAVSVTAAKPTVSDIVLSDVTVLEPMILFCTHALRMRDTRCCSLICKTFRTIVPMFQSMSPPAPQVREFISTEVLKACITSLNEPYFADLQKDLASLIALILLLYSARTDTPRNVLLSLPDMTTARVDKTLGKICKQPPPSERTQRSLVLDLLEGVRGVSIYEAGKIRPAQIKKTAQSKYMEVQTAPKITNGDDAGLEGVAGLFGES
jgi:exportin-5